MKKYPIITLALGAVMSAGAACGGSSGAGGLASLEQASASDPSADSKAPRPRRR